MTTSWQANLDSVNMGAHALAYARRGWVVIPIWWPSSAKKCACHNDDCENHGKHPIVGFSGSTDSAVISKWWARWPNANIGILTGELSDFTVLDIDGLRGQSTFRRLMEKHGRPNNTVVSISGSFGMHILFKYRPSHTITTNGLPGIDVFANRKFMIAPPSMHASGNRYRWHPLGHPRNTKIVEAPTWVERIFRGEYISKRRSNGNSSNGGPACEGDRNNTLFRHACRMQRQGLPDEELSDRVHALNREMCKPPLRDREVETIVSSALRYKKGA
jgi:hypothetical protein